MDIELQELNTERRSSVRTVYRRVTIGRLEEILLLPEEDSISGDPEPVVLEITHSNEHSPSRLESIDVPTQPTDPTHSALPVTKSACNRSTRPIMLKPPQKQGRTFSCRCLLCFFLAIMLIAGIIVIFAPKFNSHLVSLTDEWQQQIKSGAQQFYDNLCHSAAVVASNVVILLGRLLAQYGTRKATTAAFTPRHTEFSSTPAPILHTYSNASELISAILTRGNISLSSATYFCSNQVNADQLEKCQVNWSRFKTEATKWLDRTPELTETDAELFFSLTLDKGHEVSISRDTAGDPYQVLIVDDDVDSVSHKVQAKWTLPLAADMILLITEEQTTGALRYCILKLKDALIRCNLRNT